MNSAKNVEYIFEIGTQEKSLVSCFGCDEVGTPRNVVMSNGFHIGCASCIRCGKLETVNSLLVDGFLHYACSPVESRKPVETVNSQLFLSVKDCEHD